MTECRLEAKCFRCLQDIVSNVVVIVARRTAAAAGKATGRGAGRGRKSRVKAAPDAPVLPSLDHQILPPTDPLTSMEPQSTVIVQEPPAVSGLSSLELGASVEVEASVEVVCGPSKSAEPTVLLGKCCCCFFAA